MAKALHNVDVGMVLSGNVMNNLRFADDIAAVTAMNITYRWWWMVSTGKAPGWV